MWSFALGGAELLACRVSQHLLSFVSNAVVVKVATDVWRRTLNIWSDSAQPRSATLQQTPQYLDVQIHSIYRRLCLGAHGVKAASRRCKRSVRRSFLLVVN